MAEKRDYYEVLGVKKDATADEIKKAYRKVTKENHSRMMTLTWHFISTTKLLVASLFACVVIMCMRGENLSAMFMPIVLTVLCANSLFWVVRLFQAR